jgi:hypothetical protein
MVPPANEQSPGDTGNHASSESHADFHPRFGQRADASRGIADPGWLAAIKRIFPVWRLQPSGLELPFDERRKRRLFSALIVPGMVILFVFGFFHLFTGNFLEGGLDVIGGLWLLSSILWLHVAIKGLPIYRINTILLGLLFLFLAAKGGIQSNKLLWMICRPSARSRRRC